MLGHSQAWCNENKVYVRALGLLECWMKQTSWDLIHTTDYQQGPEQVALQIISKFHFREG